MELQVGVKIILQNKEGLDQYFKEVFNKIDF